jgi:hypothetical protein
MKHLIIAAIVCLGLLAQSSPVTIDHQTGGGQAVAAIGSSPEGNAQQLNAREMRATVGGDNVSGCWKFTDELGDVHGICCLDLWIITVCAGVNWSAFERLLDF